MPIKKRHLAECIRARINWYERAIAMQTGEIEWDNHFGRPPSRVEPGNNTSLCEWRGALHELKNTLDMLEAV